ncbi:MAG: aminotransferase class I/II-fold pyridoxal phosphate-dependent enzyme [Acidimicrobiales bacterium]|nr:aminotransferase class I/II-fold pyridoxal phosphate-dependent enzyme [Acidimicrobiales bacterium]
MIEPAPDRVHLSPPDTGDDERALLLEALDSGWVAPAGPHLTAFEDEMAAVLGVPAAAALSSGTAALHLALLLCGVGPGDEVLVPTLTFVASANAVTYTGARPVFVDSDASSWCMDPALVAEELARCARRGRLPAAVVAVDLYGQCADLDPIVEICTRYEVPVVEDAAEALGATYRGRPAGSLTPLGVLSFNGNKIITTGGGGMLVGDDPEAIERARYLATQARQPAPHYEHTETGFNYRLGNLAAAVGLGQLRHLGEKVARRRAIRRTYEAAFAELAGITMMPVAAYGEPTHWLSVLTIDAEALGASREDVRVRLEAADIESRPAWKPMHRQPLFAGCRALDTGVADRVFERGLCLPSGSGLTEAQQARVIEVVYAAVGQPATR